MRKYSPLMLIFCLALVTAVPIAGSVSNKERTLLIRVKAAESGEPITFSMSYQAGASGEMIELKNQSTPFDLRINGNTLNATFQKETGEPKMYVEVIQFERNRQVGTVTGDGLKVEIEVQPNSDGSQMKVRSFE